MTVHVTSLTDPTSSTESTLDLKPCIQYMCIYLFFASRLFTTRTLCLFFHHIRLIFNHNAL